MLHSLPQCLLWSSNHHFSLIVLEPCGFTHSVCVCIQVLCIYFLLQTETCPSRAKVPLRLRKQMELIGLRRLLKLSRFTSFPSLCKQQQLLRLADLLASYTERCRDAAFVSVTQGGVGFPVMQLPHAPVISSSSKASGSLSWPGVTVSLVHHCALSRMNTHHIFQGKLTHVSGSLRCIARDELPIWRYCNCKSLNDCHTVFQSNCPILDSYHQQIEVKIPPHLAKPCDCLPCFLF